MMAVREQMKRISEERVSIKFQGQEHAWWGGSRNDREIHMREAYGMKREALRRNQKKWGKLIERALRPQRTCNSSE